MAQSSWLEDPTALCHSSYFKPGTQQSLWVEETICGQSHTLVGATRVNQIRGFFQA